MLTEDYEEDLYEEEEEDEGGDGGDDGGDKGGDDNGDEGDGSDGDDGDDKGTLEEKEERIKELEEELTKEKEKDKNFKALKDKEKGKRGKIGDRVDALETQVKQEQENRQVLQDSIMGEAKATAIEQLSGDDKDLQQKLEDAVKAAEAYLGAPKDSKELTKRYENAYKHIEGSQKRVSPLHAMHPVTGTPSGSKGDKKYPDTVDGKAMMKQHFPDIVKAEEAAKK